MYSTLNFVIASRFLTPPALRHSHSRQKASALVAQVLRSSHHPLFGQTFEYYFLIKQGSTRTPYRRDYRCQSHVYCWRRRDSDSYSRQRQRASNCTRQTNLLTRFANHSSWCQWTNCNRYAINISRHDTLSWSFKLCILGQVLLRNHFVHFVCFITYFTVHAAFVGIWTW